MRARIVASVVLLIASACGGTVALEANAPDDLSNEARVAGPNGLEQRLIVVVDPDDYREPGFHTLSVTSDVTNTSAAPISLSSRVCLFFESDVRITADADRLEPFVTCGAVEQSRQLAPGESVGPLRVLFRLRSGPGQYSVRLRHALKPEFWATASFRIP